MKKCTITSAIVAALYMVYAGWDPDERLTNNISLSQVGYDRNIAFSNNEIGEWMHVVWYDYRNGNWETYYKMWSPWLSSWGKYQNLSSNSSQSVNPSIAATETKAHVVWLNPSDIL